MKSIYRKYGIRGLLAVLVLMMCIGSTAPLAAVESDPTAELDRYVDRYRQTMNIPAGSVTILQRGEPLYSRTWGEGVTQDTRFYIGSTTKSFTAIAIMQLVEQEQVDLDSPVSAYIPEFAVSDAITVRHLLNHTSGMTEFDFMTRLPPEATTAELVAEMNSMTPSHPPGEVFAYFNPNYSLLGHIVEQISGTSYAEYVAEHIFLPLNMNQACARGNVDVPGNLSVFGFSLEREQPFLQFDLPAGYITASSEEVARFLEAVRTRDPVLGVSEAGIEGMFVRTEAAPYGMGWMLGEHAGQPSIQHGGSLPGYVSQAMILPEDEYSISLLVNKNHMLYAVFLYPDLSAGILSILTRQTVTDRLTLHWIYRLFGCLSFRL